MRVLKFGGTSLQDGAALARMVAIVSARRNPLVVVSAMGKTTDRLDGIAERAAAGRAALARAELERLRLDTLSAAGGLVDARAAAAFADLFRRLSGLLDTSCCGGPRCRDLFLAHGELVSSVVAASALRRAGRNAEVFDVRRVVITDGCAGGASPRFDEIRRRALRCLAPRLSRGPVVTQGFIGSTAAGVTTVLGRGGSDTTATLLGAALGAEAVEIWTDVDGVMTADPRVAPTARPIPRLSYSEAEELARSGARVLHPASIGPVARHGIPMWVRNSRRPAFPGTLIAQADAGERRFPTAETDGAAGFGP
jgi:aspartate kinase